MVACIESERRGGKGMEDGRGWGVHTAEGQVTVPERSWPCPAAACLCYQWRTHAPTSSTSSSNAGASANTGASAMPGVLLLAEDTYVYSPMSVTILVTVVLMNGCG